jgi:parallel beta-helix repeat protein
MSPNTNPEDAAPKKLQLNILKAWLSKRKLHPPPWQAITFALIFAFIGGYFIWHSLAATPVVATIEAEQMTLPSGGSVVNDSTASNGKGVQLTQSGTSLTGSISLPSQATSVSVVAHGLKCRRGWPTMAVVIDGSSLISNISANSSSWQTYTAGILLNSGGVHSISIKDTSRYSCRYLYVDKVVFYGPAITTPAPTISFSASPVSVMTGNSSTLTWSSTNASSCIASGAWNGNEPTSGSISTGALNATATYGLSCSGNGGSANANATVNVGGASTTYYVSTTGNDSNPGTQALPWLTVGHAANVVTSAGSTVMIMSGIYTADVKITHGGITGQPITYQSYPNQTATIVGRLWIANGANYLTLQNLKLVGNPNNPNDLPSPEINAQNVTLANNDISNAHTSICVGVGSDGPVYGAADNATITGNRIHDCGVLPALNHEHGIYVEDAKNVIITNNQIYNNADRGIQLYPDTAGSVINQVDIYHNVIDGNGEGVLFSGNNGSAASNVNVHNNIITFSNVRYNVESYYPSGTNPGSNNTVQSNCIYGGIDDTGSGGIDTSSGGFSLLNNIIANPLYSNRAAQNYTLQSGSPCAGIFSNTSP